MKGMDALVQLRRNRLKPQAVYVQLVAVLPDERSAQITGMGHTGIVTILIAASESLSDIDFRPLTGLFVCVEDHASDPERLRQAAVLIAQQEPETLWMPEQWDSELIAFHIRRKGPPATSETHHP